MEKNVDDIRKERMILAISTLAGMACMIQNYFGGWEFWVPPVLFVVTVLMWIIHIGQKMEPYSRINIYFIYVAFLVFYHGIHEANFWDVSVVFALYFVTFAMADRVGLLNIILTEYAVVMTTQLYFLYRDTKTVTDAFMGTRIAFHIGTMLLMYVFCRIAVNRRMSERDRIEKWQESVAESDRDMEDFLSNISHELRTPVNVISGMTTLMQKTNNSAELISIRDAGIRLAHQIEDIQDYTEIKRGELALEEENYMVVSLINDVVSNFKDYENRDRLELVVDLDPKTPTMMNGDIKKLHKVFRHLLDNSVKFTSYGGIYIKVFIVPQEYGANLTVEVTDTGCGMSRASISQVSKGMYQANKKRNRSTGGIGIGLPIVYGFVHKMGGFVSINSTRGKGTTVRLSVPQKIVDHQPCLAVKEGTGDILFYIKSEKYKVPEIREFYREMAVNTAKGLKKKLYSAGEIAELERLVAELDVSHVFTGQEEYGKDHEVLDRLAKDGIKIVVSANPGYDLPTSDGVVVIPKPMYAFPIVRILNGEEGKPGGKEFGKVRFTGVSALIVDDEPMNLVVASGLLKEYKMFTETAESGREAIEKYSDEGYDVIFMDHMMPGMDGVEAMKRIREIAAEHGRSPIIIALTANVLSGAKEMFANEGFDGFIAKPIELAEFERVMKHVLPEKMIRYEGRDEQ